MKQGTKNTLTFSILIAIIITLYFSVTSSYLIAIPIFIFSFVAIFVISLVFKVLLYVLDRIDNG